MQSKSSYSMEFLSRPGRTLEEQDKRLLVLQLKDIAASCFDPLPDYQCIKETEEDLDDKIIVLARNQYGQLVGFASAIVLPVKGLGNVLHLGLTCVRPQDRQTGLTHRLSSYLITQYYLRSVFPKKLWVSNVACVLSSLGNVALHFENIFPSPFGSTLPSLEHFKIARSIDQHYRHKIFIHLSAVFDPWNFVFRGSVKNTVFQKDDYDSRYWHRNEILNDYYRGLMDFKEGDEVLQVGYVSALTPFKYFMKRWQLGRRRFFNSGGGNPVLTPV